ncbi:MAG: phosphoribosyltransferase [Candidatus Bathyarchaeota archaeon]|nr:phosphoribosyltransferase [Candidatus Bathyarchaeota archaeon]
MSLDIQFEVPTWDEIYEMLLNLAEKIRKDRFHPDIIVGISRGGWPPARVMSDLLENPKLANVKVEFYSGIAKTADEPAMTQPVSTAVKGRNVLILDDVVDSGKSLRLVKKHVVNKGAEAVKSAAIYYKPWSMMAPDYYEKETERWIVFPWERRETVRCLVKNCRKEGIPIERAKERLVEGGMDQTLVERFIGEAVKEELE